MIRKILNLTLLVALVVLAGTACLKKSSDQAADDKSYLVDPNDVTTPAKPKPDPCLNKGALGAQGLILKGACPDLNVPKCGNGKPEGSEACDEGSKNGLDGSTCTIDCKKIADKPGAGDTDKPGASKVLKITTQSLPDKSLGDKYSASVKATGGKNSKDYKWTVTGLPEEFEYKSNNDAVTIASKGVLTKTGTHKPAVQVCLVSEPATCVTCPESVCSFSIKDGVTLTASRSSASKFVCDSSNGSNCGALTVLPTENIFGFVNADGPKFLLTLNVGSYFPADKNFQWKLSVKDGSGVKEIPVVKAIEQLQCNPLINAKKEVSASCNGKAASFPGGIFLMEPKHNDDQGDDVGENAGKGTYHKHYVMFGPEAYGKTYETVEISVKNNTTGGEQKILFDKITLPTLQQFTDAKEAKKLEQDKKNPCYGKTSISVPSMMVNEEKVDGKVNEEMNSVVYNIKGKLFETFEATMPVVGGVPPYKIETNEFGGPVISNGGSSAWSVPKPLGGEWKWTSSLEGLNLNGSFDYTFKYASPNTGRISDNMEAIVTDACGHSTTVWVAFDVGLPEASGTISNLRLLADYRTADTDGSSNIKIELFNKDGVLIATTGEMGVDGDDPTCFNRHYSLTAVSGHENDSIDQIGSIRLYGKDNPYFYEADMTLKIEYLRLEVLSNNKPSYYAVDEGQYSTFFNSNSWTHKITFKPKKNPSNGSIWFHGEPPKHNDLFKSCDEYRY